MSTGECQWHARTSTHAWTWVNCQGCSTGAKAKAEEHFVAGSDMSSGSRGGTVAARASTDYHHAAIYARQLSQWLKCKHTHGDSQGKDIIEMPSIRLLQRKAQHWRQDACTQNNKSELCDCGERQEWQSEKQDLSCKLKTLDLQSKI